MCQALSQTTKKCTNCCSYLLLSLLLFHVQSFPLSRLYTYLYDQPSIISQLARRYVKELSLKLVDVDSSSSQAAENAQELEGLIKDVVCVCLMCSLRLRVCTCVYVRARLHVCMRVRTRVCMRMRMPWW